MKIIFLDIDGVLINEKSYHLPKHLGLLNTFDPLCVEQLNRLTDQSDAKIVITSTWRRFQGIEHILNEFSRQGITGETIDATPYLENRGEEILAWIKHNADIDLESYVVIDDDSADITPYIEKKRFVKTEFMKGFQKDKCDQALDILNVE